MSGKTQRSLALLCLLSALGLFGYAASTGEASVGIFFIVPYIVGSGLASFLGMLFIMAALILFMLSFSVPPYQSNNAGQISHRKSGFGGVILIGPVPIIFGSDIKMTILSAILSIFIVLVLFWLFYSRLLF